MIYTVFHLICAFWLSFLVIACIYAVIALRLWRLSAQTQFASKDVARRFIRHRCCMCSVDGGTQDDDRAGRRRSPRPALVHANDHCDRQR